MSQEVKDKVPLKSNLKIKEQDKGHMVFNLETSGFHLLQKDGIDVMDKADGKRTVKDIADIISKERKEDSKDTLNQLTLFFTELERRKLVRWKP